LGVIRYLLRIRRAPVVAGVVLILMAEESGDLVKAELERVKRITRMRIAATTNHPERQVLFEVHVLPGAESVTTDFLRQALPDAHVTRLPRARQEDERSRSGHGIHVPQWLTDEITSLQGGDGKGATVVVLDRGFNPEVLTQIAAETSLKQLDVPPEFQKALPTKIAGHGTAILSLVHLAAPKADLLWQFEPETPDVSIRKRSDTASRMWLIAYVSMIRDMHTEGGYPKVLNRPVVVNLSISLGFGDSTGADDSELAAVLDSVLALAVQVGIIFVAAAGNAPPAYPMAYPAISSKTIGVGALNQAGEPARFNRAGGKSGLWLMAPGGYPDGEPSDTASLDHEGPALVGTSYSCAIASGLIAGAAASSDRQQWLDSSAVTNLLRMRALSYPGCDSQPECAGRINVNPTPA